MAGGRREANISSMQSSQHALLRLPQENYLQCPLNPSKSYLWEPNVENWEIEKSQTQPTVTPVSHESLDTNFSCPPQLVNPASSIGTTNIPTSQPLGLLSTSSVNSRAHRPSKSTTATPIASTPRPCPTQLRPPTQPYNFTLFSRRVFEPPKPFKVYFMPNGQQIPSSSVIHTQKRQNGFFRHPMLVIGSSKDGKYVYFYALTTSPPTAIRDLGMYLRLGGTSKDEGKDTLKLIEGSDRMQLPTFVNLEQLFYIEWHYFEHWKSNVLIDPRESIKLENKVNELEAQQNRFIYKPVPRDLSNVTPGTVLMLSTPSGSSTLGAPVIVVRNLYPRFQFLRIKTTEQNPDYRPPGMEKNKNIRRICLKMCRYPEQGHDGTPVLLFEPDSPEMRMPSYVEVNKKLRETFLDDCKTWCFPHVRLQASSMKVLWECMEILQDQDPISQIDTTFMQDPPAIQSAPPVNSQIHMASYNPYMPHFPAPTSPAPYSPWILPSIQHHVNTAYDQQSMMKSFYQQHNEAYHPYLQSASPTLHGHTSKYPWTYQHQTSNIPVQNPERQRFHANSTRPASAAGNSGRD